MAGMEEAKPELRCEICGSTKDLRIHDGMVICKKCFQSLPRRQCAARNKRGYRCKRTVVGDGLLCAAHEAAGAEPLEWELCPTCKRTYRPVGEPCPYCGSTEPVDTER